MKYEMIVSEKKIHPLVPWSDEFHSLVRSVLYKSLQSNLNDRLKAEHPNYKRVILL